MFRTIVIYFIFVKYCYHSEPVPVTTFVDSDMQTFLVPYIVSIERHGNQFCGGSLIRPGIVLTAAHCMDGESIGNLRVRAGSLYRHQDGITRSVRVYRIHPDFDLITKNYDVAVMQLSAPFNVNEASIATIKLAKSTPEPGPLALVSGWGKRSETGQFSERLKAVRIPIWNKMDCSQYTRYYHKSKICAAHRIGGDDACAGDSGGPLVVNAQQIGVTSYGIGCGRQLRPGVYANVAYLRSWIEENANQLETYFQ